MSTSKDQDERLQQYIEQGLEEEALLASFEKEDIGLYRDVFQSLAEPREVVLSPGFTQRVAAAVQAEQDQLYSAKWALVALMACGFILLDIGVSAYGFHAGPSEHMLGLVWHFRWYALFALCCIFLIQALDQFLSRRRLAAF